MADETPVAVRQLNKLSQYADRLPDIIAASQLVSPGLTLRGVTTKISETLKISERELRDVFLALDNIRVMADNLHGADKALDRLFDIYRGQLTDAAAKRSAIMHGLGLYNEDNPASISLKARKLSILQENLLIDAEIITDARPIYDSKGENIVEWVINHSLVVTYQQSNTTKRLHLAVDVDDIGKIRQACERAVIKAHTLKKTLGDKAREVSQDAI